MAQVRSAFAMLGLLGAIAGAAIAQDARRGDDDSEAPPEVDVDSIPVEQYTEVAAATVTTLRTVMQKGLDEVKAARDEKDAVRLTCVNEPVATMKGVLRVGEDANASLLEALALQNIAEARREFRKLKKNEVRMQALLREAQSCAGAMSSESSASVELAIDEELIAFDAYYGNPNFFFDPQSSVAEGTDSSNLGEGDDVTLRPPPASGVS
jgi:hypothetical protein